MFSGESKSMREITGHGAVTRQVGTRELNVEIRMREMVGDNRDAGFGRNRILKKSESSIIQLAVLAAVMLIAGTYTAVHIGKGWVPADDGALSQSALRVFQGQLPHRDFGEIYTGGLSFIHAFAFRMLGVNLMSLRICVFLFFLAWLPAVYYIGLRFTSAIGAGAITLLAVSWSYPNYPAAMPSWYNLFFATFGAAALLRYLEVRTRRWLFIAGVCGGASILVKVIGAYYIAGVLLFLTFLEQSESAEHEIENSSPQHNWPFRLFTGGALLLFLATLIRVLHARLGKSEIYHFVLPSAALVGLILLGEWNLRARTAQRFKSIFCSLIPFLSGIAVPIIIFLIPYARSGGVWNFLFGVTSSAVARSSDLGVVRPIGVEKLFYILPLIGVLAAAMYWDRFQGKTVGAALGLGATVIALKAYQTGDMVNGIWFSAALLTPAVVLLGALLVWLRRKDGARTKLGRQQVVLLIALAGTCTLVQFPFAAPIYLSYAVPLTLLALLAIVSAGKTQPGTYALAAVVGLYMAIGVLCLVPHYIYEITWLIGDVQTMHEPRGGGLKIEEAVYFDELSRFLREHSPNGLMFAGNDCPELYFLSGLKNVSRDDSGAEPKEILKAIESDNLNLVVINDAPFFPGAVMHPEVRAEVMKRFPHSTRFGIFQVFWKQ
jgi:hypothetical protein